MIFVHLISIGLLKLDYVELRNWNLKGALLNHAAFAFAEMSQADLRGAKLQKISIGYTSIQGLIDAFTEYPNFCKVQRNLNDASQQIICSM